MPSTPLTFGPRGRSVGLHLLWLLVAMMAGWALAQGTGTSFEAAPCPFEIPVGLVEGDTLECGYLRVPERRDLEGGRSLRLAVARLLPPGGPTVATPVLFLQGGPGGSVLETLPFGLPPSFTTLLESGRELILFDQRGVGLSEPALDCPGFRDLYLDLLDFELGGVPLNARQRLQRKLGALEACAADLRLEADLSAYHTAENAADVDALRAALGHEAVDLWGGSYGSRLALEVLRQFPGGVRSAVLEAVVPPDVDLFLETPGDFAASLEGVFADCAADAGCGAAYPDLRGRFFATVEQLDAEPVLVEVLHPLTRGRVPLRIGGDTFVELVFRTLYNTDLRPYLPQMLLSAEGGSFDLLLLAANDDLLRQDLRSWGMYLSTLCHDEIPFSSWDAFVAELNATPAFAGFFTGFEVGGLSYGICPLWGAGAAEAGLDTPVRSDVTTLLLVGESDPIAPPEWAYRVAQTLSRGYLYSYPGLGHGLSSRPCAQQMMVAFLDDPNTPPQDRCRDALALPPFVLPGAGEAVQLEPFESVEMGLRGVRPVGWSELGPGTFARSASAADAVALTVQAAPLDPQALLASMQQRLDLPAPPDLRAERRAHGLVWRLYGAEVQGIAVELALAEREGGVFLVVLQSPQLERDALYRTVFLAAIDGVEPLGGAQDEEPEDGPEDGPEDAGRYRDPGGRFSVPIPTNWRVDRFDDYAALVSPEGEMTVYVLALEADDFEAGVRAAWVRVDPDFELEPVQVIEEPVTNGAERAVTLLYDAGDDLVVLAGGWYHQGVAYLEIARAALEPFQKRVYQLQIINTGYRIEALAATDLAIADARPLADVLEAFRSYLQEKMVQLEVPGAAIAIVQGGETVYAEGFGVRDLESGEPVTPETRMMIGSSTKSMTTLLMAQLVDDGVFAWDTPVIEILPSFRVADPEVSERITVRNLVCACSGVPRRDLEWMFNADGLDAEGVIASLADFEFFTDFGEAFQYSNQMVAAGGFVAALAATDRYGELDEAYRELLQDRVLGPLGMDSTTFSFDEVRAAGDAATPYGVTMTGAQFALPLQVEEVLIPVAPAGALWSNVDDMSAYLATLLAQGVSPQGERVVSADNLAKTLEPQVAVTADISYGLGWLIEDYHGVTVISHAGNTFGFTSELAFVPELDLGISVLVNQRGSAFGAVVRARLLELLFDREADIEAMVEFQRDMVGQRNAELSADLRGLDREALAPYLGRYRHPALGEISLRFDGDALLLDAGEFSVEVRAFAGDVPYATFATPLEGFPLKLGRAEDGRPTVTLGVGVLEYLFTR